MMDWMYVWSSLLISVAFALAHYFRTRQAKGYIPKNHRPLFLPRGSLFTAYFFMVIGYAVRYYKEDFLSSAIVLMLILSGVMALLLLLLPILRKKLLAESCAVLWTIPCILPLYFMKLPRWCITLPFSPLSKQTVMVLFWIWLVGFSAVMIGRITAHIIFRHYLLKNAKPMENETNQLIWLRQLKVANLSADTIRLCISPNTQTPLSIGLFWRSTCLVLPERIYTPEELEMVLQHELIHISRRDSVMKFTMTLCAAFMWFNPLAWIAIRICAQDLELSCDEAVVYGRPPQARKAYATLLLQTAPRQAGFTSCLSASARSLRYRMKNIVTEQKRIIGSFLLGALCFLMLLGSVFTGVRYQPMAAKELLFTQWSIDQLDVGEIYSVIDGVTVNGECAQDQLLLQYIETLSLQKTTEKPDLYDATCSMQLAIHAPDRNYKLTFGDNYLRVDTVADHLKTAYYRLENTPDWQLLTSCIG